MTKDITQKIDEILDEGLWDTVKAGANALKQGATQAKNAYHASVDKHDITNNYGMRGLIMQTGVIEVVKATEMMKKAIEKADAAFAKYDTNTDTSKGDYSDYNQIKKMYKELKNEIAAVSNGRGMKFFSAALKAHREDMSSLSQK